MNATVAKNVRTFREIKHWTQQHLADTADIELRTVQRVEAGHGASVDTLAAVAAAFDVSIAFLEADLDAAVARAAQEHEKFMKTHDLVPVAPVACSADLEVIGGCHAYLMHCASKDEAMLDAFTGLRSNLSEIGDIWDDMNPEQQREWVKETYAQVLELNELGLVVCLGKAKRIHRAGPRPIEFMTLYVVAWPKGEEKTHIAVDKSA